MMNRTHFTIILNLFFCTQQSLAGEIGPVIREPHGDEKNDKAPTNDFSDNFFDENINRATSGEEGKLVTSGIEQAIKNTQVGRLAETLKLSKAVIDTMVLVDFPNYNKKKYGDLKLGSEQYNYSIQAKDIAWTLRPLNKFAGDTVSDIFSGAFISAAVMNPTTTPAAATYFMANGPDVVSNASQVLGEVIIMESVDALNGKTIDDISRNVDNSLHQINSIQRHQIGCLFGPC